MVKIELKKPWLKNWHFDLGFIILPAYAALFLVFLFSEQLNHTTQIPLWVWVCLVLAIDVSHVYSTLFRTYFNSNEFEENKLIFTLIPVFVWIVGAIIYSFDGLLFWRFLAYVAVFHFIRQQYGFVRLYSRNDNSSKLEVWFDQLCIYVFTLYPIIFWHTHLPRNFHWFVDGDFLSGVPKQFEKISFVIYLAVLVLFFLKEVFLVFKLKKMNILKLLVVISTAMTWYFGIVYFNGDMIFTLTNIVAHGIPYLALIWLYGEREKDKVHAPLIFNRFSYKFFFSKYSLPIYFGLLFVFAFLEEGFWAGLVWREHLEFFKIFSSFPIVTSRETLSWLVPLLTLPQATHYVLDGFIWKVRDKNAYWQQNV